MSEVKQILERFKIDPKSGFLPPKDPLLSLPSPYEVWEELALNLTAYINAGSLRQKIDRLTLVDNPQFSTTRELERAMLLLSFFAHAYVHLPPNPVKHIPASIAVPWIKVANLLKRKPILSHASVVLNNWKRLDKQKSVQLNNLATICQFHGGLDESWFYLVTVEIEQVGAKAIPMVLEVIESVNKGNLSKAADCLNKVNTTLKSLTAVLRKMYDSCDPHIFYLRVRPFLASFDLIDYQGTGLPAQSHHGGSAAQSSLLQFFDAAFGVQYEHKSTKNYLRLMRQHMPIKHAEFLDYIESTSSIKENISKSKDLEDAYKSAINLLLEFRNEHLKMVALYIMKPAKQSNSSSKGTGGTNPMVFLKSVRNQNENLL